MTEENEQKEQKLNGVASVADFRKLAEASAWEEPERLTLPKCKFVIVVRKPKPIAFALYGLGLPAEMMRKPTPGTLPSNEDLIGARKMWELMSGMFVQPRLAPHFEPGPDEISVMMIPEDDQWFLIGWALGLVGSGGAGLELFRDKVLAEQRRAELGASGGVGRSEAAVEGHPGGTGGDGRDVREESVGTSVATDTRLPN
jgi:hypothetical protein